MVHGFSKKVSKILLRFSVVGTDLGLVDYQK